MSQHADFDWKRIAALPFAAAFNAFNRMCPDRGYVLKVPDWKHNYPSWTRDVQSKALVHTIHGFDIVCDAHDYVGRHIITHKDWEALIARTIRACARPGGLCIDVGANIGFHTLLMSTCVGPSGRVIAFEPDLQNLGFLIDNAKLNQLENILTVSVALSDHAGIVQMDARSGVNYGLSNIRENGTGGQPAMVVRGDVLPLVNEGEEINIIKIDVEGLEEQVLRGLSGILQKARHVFCEISPEWVNAENIFKLMKDNGFSYLAAPPFHEGNWFSPEKKTVEGQHDVLFYRNMSPELAELVTK